MKLTKYQSKKTYKSEKDGKEHHFYNYQLVLDNGTRVLIKPVNREGYATLNAVAEYVSSK